MRATIFADQIRHLLAEPLPTLRDEILTQPFHHIDAFRRLGQLPFCGREHPLQTHHKHIPHDKHPTLVGTAASFLPGWAQAVSSFPSRLRLDGKW